MVKQASVTVVNDVGASASQPHATPPWNASLVYDNLLSAAKTATKEAYSGDFDIKWAAASETYAYAISANWIASRKVDHPKPANEPMDKTPEFEAACAVYETAREIACRAQRAAESANRRQHAISEMGKRLGL
jgi:hypothetical protein